MVYATRVIDPMGAFDNEALVETIARSSARLEYIELVDKLLGSPEGRSLSPKDRDAIKKYQAEVKQLEPSGL